MPHNVYISLQSHELCYINVLLTNGPTNRTHTVTRYKHTNNSKTMYVRMQRVIINILLREGRGWRASLVRHPLEESAEDMCS